MIDGYAPVIGVLGGMGPAATADFYMKLVSRVCADVDQEHPKVIIWSDPTVPDRSRAIAQDGPDPTPWLLSGAARLSQAGATVLAMPCNTAHAFRTAIVDHVDIPVIDMICEVVERVATSWQRADTVGVLATTGTINAWLYQHAFARVGINVVIPDDVTQDDVDGVIRAVKAGRRERHLAEVLARVGETLGASGAGMIVAGCSEIPLVLGGIECSVPLIDSTLVLADAVLRHTGYDNVDSHSTRLTAAVLECPE